MQRYRVQVTNKNGGILLAHITAHSIVRAHRIALSRWPDAQHVNVRPAYKSCVPEVATFATA